MRLVVGLLVSLLCGPFGMTTARAAEIHHWERVGEGFQDIRVVAIAVHPADSKRLYAASHRAMYHSVDGGSTWHERFRTPAQTTITSLSVNGEEPPALLLATDRGLYASSDGGNSWSRAFRAIGEGKASCTVVLFHPAQHDIALLGTRGGLFVTTDRGRHWNEAPVPLAAREVQHVAFDPRDPDRVHLVARNGLFSGSLTTGSWQQRFSLIHTQEETTDEPATTETEEEVEGQPDRLTAVALDPALPLHVYLAGARGVTVTEDAGLTWTPLTRSGLLSPAISRLLLQRRSPLAIYAATARGVACYDSGHASWTMITGGLTNASVNDLAATATHLWAATDEGLFRFSTPLDPFEESEPPAPQELLANFSHEPTIRYVQEMAIRYAEVHPDKIRRWRRQAALKALLPHVNVGLDRDTSQNIHVDEGSFPNFQILETRDRDASMDFSVTWELGDLIWNNDQTSIDTRSKLMVQLRDDIIDEVTRAYFERRRLQVVLLTEPPKDSRALLEKELRVQELTALIDGMTGGDFSRRMTVTAN